MAVRTVGTWKIEQGGTAALGSITLRVREQGRKAQEKARSKDVGAIRDHRQLEVHQVGFKLAMEVFVTSKSFPLEERHSLTDQTRRSSRAVCSNLAEAWRKRRYEAAFVAKLSDSEAEADETQTWLDFATQCGYLEATRQQQLRKQYDLVIGKLVLMINKPEPWILK